MPVVTSQSYKGAESLLGFFFGGGWAAAPTEFPRAVLDTEIPRGSLPADSVCLVSLGPAVGSTWLGLRNPVSVLRALGPGDSW